MLALPVLHSRVAPVLDWCSRWRIVAKGTSGEGIVREVVFEGVPPHEILRALREEGVTMLICGAVSMCLKRYAERLGMKIMEGVSGEVQDVVAAYRSREFRRRRFRLPVVEPASRRDFPELGPRWGCLGGEEEKGMPSVKGPGGRDSRQGGSGRRSEGEIDGPSGTCLCPRCGGEVSHSLGIACRDMRCPQCDRPMIRK